MQALAATPITPQMQLELNEATQRLAAIKSTLKIASFNYPTLALFGALSLVASIYEVIGGTVSVIGWVLAIGLLALAWNEKRGRDLTLDFNLTGPKRLVLNQLGILTIVVASCAYSVGSLDSAISASDRQTINDAFGKGTFERIVYSGIGAILLVVGSFQLLFAYCYHRMGKRVAAHLAVTPDWIVQMQRHQR